GKGGSLVIGKVEHHKPRDTMLRLTGWFPTSTFGAANPLFRGHSAQAELEAARFQDLMRDRGDDERRLCMRADKAGDRSVPYGAASGARDKLTPRSASAVRD